MKGCNMRYDKGGKLRANASSPAKLEGGAMEESTDPATPAQLVFRAKVAGLSMCRGER